MITLYIDTSDKDVSIAIIKDNQQLANITKTIPNEHSVYAVPFIKEALDTCKLEPNHIDNIMVVNGPGSFTGIRIGITIAKVYAYLLKKEIRTISSLKALALSTEGNYILSLIDAKHNNYYLGLYDTNYNEVIKEQFASQDTLIELINKYNPKLVSNDNLIIDNISIPKQNINIPKVVSYYLTKETENPHLVVPNYLKLPQAMESKQ
jgi:tRNA threonylcarbamoyladenosine biosynthesis protein TsaB